MTIHSTIMKNLGIEIDPTSRMLAWLLRHVGYLILHCHVRREGVTAAHALWNSTTTHPLCQWGEKVHFKNAEPENNQTHCHGG